MTSSHAQHLRESWGGRPCAHPALEKEVDDAGAATGDYVCTTCGESRWGRDWPQREKKGA